MQPLSTRKRRIYLYALVALFFLALPAAIFYAQGYRFDQGGVRKTGGIFLSVPYVGAEVFVDGEKIGESAFLRRSFYIGELTPDTYRVEVVREEDHPWRRTLVVEEELVTDAAAFLVPIQLDIVELTRGKGSVATTTNISRTRLNEFIAAFSREVATTTTSRLGTLLLKDGNVSLAWMEDEVPPSMYCEAPSECRPEIPIERGKQEAKNAAFFRDVVVYATKEGGVYLSEADLRPTALVVPLYSKPGSDFRVIDERLIIKDGERLYEILGL